MVRGKVVILVLAGPIPVSHPIDNQPDDYYLEGGDPHAGSTVECFIRTHPGRLR